MTGSFGTAQLHLRTGFEIELLAPTGHSRKSLAQHLAAAVGGQVRPVWHHDSEPSLVPGLGRFRHLTQGFEVHRADGTPLCTLVDDVTLTDGLDPRAPGPPGWFRILTDDARLLSLLAAHSDPGGPLSTALDPVAALWGRPVQHVAGVYRLDDVSGATIAMAAPQGGGRERPCEIITPPLAADHGAALAELLDAARALGFTIPLEAAVHLHLDGAPFRPAPALANVIRLFGYWREPLRALLQTNPACRRLAPLPTPLLEAVAGEPSYADLRRAAREGELTKFYDVNLTQLLSLSPTRDTLEVRILPGALHAADIVNRAALLELLLDRCLSPVPFPAPSTADAGVSVEELLAVAASVLADR